eukprot:jgi/Picsp_1/5513/NSC_02872-R1_atp-dependent dna helicase
MRVGERSPVKKKMEVASSSGREGASEDVVYSDSEDWFNLNDSSEKQCSEVPIRPVNKFRRVGVAAKVKRDSCQGRHRNLFIGSQLQKENATSCNNDDVSCEQLPTKYTWWEESCQVLVSSDQPEKRNGNPESLALTGTYGNFIGKIYGNKRDQDISRNLSTDSDVHNTLEIQKCPSRDLEEEFARIGKVDGLNVVAYRHPTTNNNLPGKKASSTGWGKNFVKLDIRGTRRGIGKTKRQSSRKFRRRSTPFLTRHVGDGADFMAGWDTKSGFRCYKCGEMGHYAAQCMTAIESNNTEESNLTIEISKVCDENEAVDASRPKSIAPLATLESEIDLGRILEDKFGHKSFRANQEQVIYNIIQGHSCLNIMPTGMGKSLCYQIAAFFLSTPVLVISPLIALMQDQCASAPKEVNAAMLWSGQSTQEAKKVLRDLASGNVRLLFISPERISNPYFLEAIRPLMPLDLAVIDEAHCISEWGQSFRPSYLRLGKALFSDIKCKAVLALTATATLETEKCIQKVLRITRSNTFRNGLLRSNIRMFVLHADSSTYSTNKWSQIIKLLASKLSVCKKILIYCSFKRDADSLSAAIVGAGIRCKSFHASCSNDSKKTIISGFSKGLFRVVVATSAFGMGIDIKDIDAVVHANMPRSLEEYIQQIGRSGRGNQPSDCYAFISSQDFYLLRSLSSCKIVKKSAIREIIIALCDIGHGKYKILESKLFMEIGEETLEAVIGYLESIENPLASFVGKVPAKVSVAFYAKAPEELVCEYPIVSSILKSCPKARRGLYAITTSKLLQDYNQSPFEFYNELSRLSQEGIIGFQVSKEMEFCVKIEQRLCKDQAEGCIEKVYLWMEKLRRLPVLRLDHCYRVFSAALKFSEADQPVALSKMIQDYFDTSQNELESRFSEYLREEGIEPLESPMIQGDTSTLKAALAVLRKAKESCSHLCPLSPNEIANILHGINQFKDRMSLLKVPMGPFWGSLINVDYHDVLIASEEAVKL